MIMTTKSGRWSDPSVWAGGAVPPSGEVVHIASGHQIIYDMESDRILSDVMSDMGSKLTWDNTKDTRLRVNSLMLNGIMELVGPAESATPGKPRHEIVYHPISGKDPGASERLGGMFMGPTRIRGYAKKGHLRSQGISIPAGATTITLTGLSTSGWRVGDTLIILGTNYVPSATSDPQYSGPTQFWGFNKGNLTQNVLNEFQFGEDEQRTITRIDGNVVTLNAPLEYAHAGMQGDLKDGQRITVLPVVANVSRSIRFRTATAEEDGHLDPYADISILQRRAHLMFMREPDIDLRYFETKNMGRTSTDPSLQVDGLPYGVDGRTITPILASQNGAPLADPNNVRGRYPIHLHWCGGPHMASPMVALIGATAWAPIGAPPIPGWGITQHGTRAAIEDCVVSNVRGAGMVSEVGVETGQWVDNVVTGCRGDGGTNDLISRPEIYTNHNGSSGIAYENQSRAVILRGNIAGSSHYGYVWHHQHSNTETRYLRDVDLRLVDGYAASRSWAPVDPKEGIASEIVQIPPFYDNICISSRNGFMVRHRAGQGYNKDHIPMLIRGFHCLNVRNPWAVPEYSHTYYTKDCLWQGPAADMSSAAVLGNVSWGWMFTNIHLRNFSLAFNDNGAGLNYDGFLIDITTENVASFTNAPYRTFTGARTHATRNMMGDWEDHPTDANQAILRRYKTLDSATDLPQPYPLAPYGRKLPATNAAGVPYPPVRPGDKPYFVPGDGTNGLASTDPSAIATSFTAGDRVNLGRIYGIIRDSVGDRRYPDWQSSESYPSQIYIKTFRDLAKVLPEQLVERWGCWNDSGTWKTRAWFLNADRFTHVKFSFYFDFNLIGFEPAFLAAHDLGGPVPEPVWPEQLEAVPPPRPLVPITKPLVFLSRTYLESVQGRAFSHRLRPNEVMTRLQITGGADASRFAISGQNLVWAGAQPAVRAAPYEVEIRATDTWGNAVTSRHAVAVISSSRVVSEISDDFDRADENLEANPAYVQTAGAAGAFAIRSNRLALTSATAGAAFDLGSLGTSEQEISVDFLGSAYQAQGRVLFRMVDFQNHLCIMLGNSTLEFYMRVNDVYTKLAEFMQGSKTIVQCVGDRIIFKQQGNYEAKIMYPRSRFASRIAVLGFDPFYEPGAMILPPDAPKGTRIGFSQTGASVANPWIDNFSARALAG